MHQRYLCITPTGWGDGDDIGPISPLQDWDASRGTGSPIGRPTKLDKIKNLRVEDHLANVTAHISCPTRRTELCKAPAVRWTRDFGQVAK